MQKSVMFRVSVRPHLHYAILRLVLTVFPLSPKRLGLSVLQKADQDTHYSTNRSNESRHPFMHYPWYEEDSGAGIAWGVLASPNWQSLLGVHKRQHVEDPIQYPEYLIWATGQGATALRRLPSDPLPLLELRFLHTDDDIRVWLLANPGKDPFDLMVLESGRDQAEGRDETPAPASGGHPFFDSKARDRWG